MTYIFVTKVQISRQRAVLENPTKSPPRNPKRVLENPTKRPPKNLKNPIKNIERVLEKQKNHTNDNTKKNKFYVIII